MVDRSMLHDTHAVVAVEAGVVGMKEAAAVEDLEQDFAISASSLVEPVWRMFRLFA